MVCVTVLACDILEMHGQGDVVSNESTVGLNESVDGERTTPSQSMVSVKSVRCFQRINHERAIFRQTGMHV